MATYTKSTGWKLFRGTDTLGNDEVKNLYTVPAGKYAFIEFAEAVSSFTGFARRYNPDGSLSDESLGAFGLSITREHYYFNGSIDRILVEGESFKVQNSSTPSNQIHYYIMEFSPQT